MAKKEYPNLKGDFRPKQPIISGNLSGLKEKSLSVLKFILGIALLPFVYSSSIAFVSQISQIQKSCQNYFWLGVIVFLVFFLFIWEPEIIYNSGHKLLEIVFNFFRPFVEIAPNLLPIYTIILFILYGILSLIVKDSWLLEYSVFLIGFSIAMHIVFTARALGSKKGDFLKANYIFGFSFVYIINAALLALLLSLVFKQFSFLDFSKSSYLQARDIFNALFKQIFVR